MVPVTPDTLQRFEAALEFEPNTGCWLWSRGAKSDGRGVFSVAGYRMLAPRFAYAAWAGPIPGGLGVLHKCDTPACVNPSHLFVGDQAVNMADASRKGRCRGPRLFGERHPLTRASDADAADIRRRAAAGEQQKVLAAEYGLSTTAVCRIVRGRSFGHMPSMLATDRKCPQGHVIALVGRRPNGRCAECCREDDRRRYRDARATPRNTRTSPPSSTGAEP